MKDNLLKVGVSILSFLLVGVLVFNMSVSHVAAAEDDTSVTFDNIENVHIDDEGCFVLTYHDVEYRSTIYRSSSDKTYYLRYLPDSSTSSYASTFGANFGSSYNHVDNSSGGFDIFGNYSYGSVSYFYSVLVLFDTVTHSFAVVAISDISAVKNFYVQGNSLYFSSNGSPFNVFTVTFYDPSSSYFYGVCHGYKRSIGANSNVDFSLGYINRSDSYYVSGFNYSNFIPVWSNGYFPPYFLDSEDSNSVTNVPGGAFQNNYIWYDPDSKKYFYASFTKPLIKYFGGYFYFNNDSDNSLVAYKLYYSLNGSSWSLLDHGMNLRVPFPTGFNENATLIYSDSNFNSVSDNSSFPTSEELENIITMFHPFPTANSSRFCTDIDYAKSSYNEFYSVGYAGATTGAIYYYYFDSDYWTNVSSQVSDQRHLIPDSVTVVYGSQDVNFAGGVGYGFFSFDIAAEFFDSFKSENAYKSTLYRGYGDKFYNGLTSEYWHILNQSLLNLQDTSLRGIYDRMGFMSDLMSSEIDYMSSIGSKINAIANNVSGFESDFGVLHSDLTTIISKIDNLQVPGGSTGGSESAPIDLDLSGVTSRLDDLKDYFLETQLKLDLIIGSLEFDDDEIPDSNWLDDFGTIKSFLVGAGSISSIFGLFGSFDMSGLTWATSTITVFWNNLHGVQFIVLLPMTFLVLNMVLKKEGIG